MYSFLGGVSHERERCGRERYSTLPLRWFALAQVMFNMLILEQLMSIYFFPRSNIQSSQTLSVAHLAVDFTRTPLPVIKLRPNLLAHLYKLHLLLQILRRT